MKKSKISVGVVTAGALVGLVVPVPTANAYGNGGGPSCASYYAKDRYSGIPLGQWNKYYKGLAAMVAQSKYSDDMGYCGYDD